MRRGRKETSLGHPLSVRTPIHGLAKKSRIEWASHELRLHRYHSKDVAVLYPLMSRQSHASCL